MMETSAVGFGLTEFLLLLFSGQFLGIVPGERDPQLIKSPPAATYCYAEWTAAGPAEVDAPGLAGLMADPEIIPFVDALKQSFGQGDEEGGEFGSDWELAVHREMPLLAQGIAQHAGCLYVSADKSPDDPSPIPVEGAVVLHLGDDLDQVLASLNRVLKTIPDYEATDHPVDHPIPVPLATVTLHREGPRLIIALGRDARHRLAQRWEQAKPEILGWKSFVNTSAALQPERLGCLTWLNVELLRRELPQKAGIAGNLALSVSQAFGLSEIDSVMTVSGTDGPDAVTRSNVNVSGAWNGLLQLLQGKPLTEADFAQIPGDADFVAAAGFDLAMVHQTLQGIVRSTAPEVLGSMDEFQRQLEQELQLKLDDVIQAFGQVITAYDSPASGGVGITGLVIALPVRDAARARLVVQRLQQLLIESLPPGSEEQSTTLRELPFDGETIHFVNSTGYMVRYGGQPPFSPAICLTERQFLIGLHPQAIKAHLRFVKSKEPRFVKTPWAEPAALRGDILSYAYFDTPRVAKSIYPLVPLLVKPALAEGQPANSPLHVGIIPSARAVLPFLRESSLTVIRHPTDVQIVQRNTLPVWLSLLLLPRLVPSDGEIWDEARLLNGRQPPAGHAPAVNLGVAEEVQQAKAEEPKPVERKELTAVEKAARRTLPFVVREMIPDDLELLIPNSVFQKLAEPPDPKQAAQRAADRERRKADRAARRAARLAR